MKQSHEELFDSIAAEVLGEFKVERRASPFDLLHDDRTVRECVIQGGTEPLRRIEEEARKSFDRTAAKERLLTMVKTEKIGRMKSSYSEMWDEFTDYTEALSEADVERVIRAVLGDP